MLTKRITDALLERFRHLRAADQLPDRAARQQAVAPHPSAPALHYDMDRLVTALSTLWMEFSLPVESHAEAAVTRGVANAPYRSPPRTAAIWPS